MLRAPQNRDLLMSAIVSRPPKSRSPMPGLLAIGLALMGLAGCAQDGVIYNQQKYLSGTKLYVTHAEGSQMPTVIRGNPSALAKADFDQIVRDDLKGSNFGRPTTFVQGPDNPPYPDERVVLVFNGPVIGQAQLCQPGIAGGGGPAPDGTRADVDRAERALSLLEQLDQPGRRRGQRRALAIASGISLAAMLFLALRPGPPIAAVASGTYDRAPDHGPDAVLDGDPDTQWLMPDASAGWLELRFDAPRAVEGLGIRNGTNAPYRDRAVERIEVALFDRSGAMLGSAEQTLALGEEATLEPPRGRGVAGAHLGAELAPGRWRARGGVGPALIRRPGALAEPLPRRYGRAR